MTKLELKNRLINRIRTTEDQDLLKEIYRLLELHDDEQDLINLSEEQKAAIQKGQQDVKAGRTKTNRESDNEINKWLEE